MRILLVDDHALFAKSLVIALGGDQNIEWFHAISEISQVLVTIQQEHPDIVLLDINLSYICKDDGLVLAKNILQTKPDTNIVFLTGYDLPVYRYEAQRIGAKGFLNKNISPQCLIHTLLKIKKGQNAFSSISPYLEELTQSEKEIIQLLASGCKRKEIATNLGISERTASNHLQHIFEKFQVNTSIEAVTKGIQLGYIRPL